MEPCNNTDRELWRRQSSNPAIDPDGFYEDSVSVTVNDMIQINVGGRVIGMDARKWHALAVEKLGPTPPPKEPGNA